VYNLSMPRSAAGSAPSLPSYSSQASPTAQCIARPRASALPAICRQSSVGGLRRSPSPIARHPSLMLAGHGTGRKHARLSVGQLGHAPSTPAFCALQPLSASPVIKVWRYGCLICRTVSCRYILVKVTWSEVYICMRLCYLLIISITLGYGTSDEKSHTFTCHRYIYTTSWMSKYLTVLPSCRAPQHFSCYLFSEPTEVGGWVGLHGWLYYLVLVTFYWEYDHFSPQMVVYNPWRGNVLSIKFGMNRLIHYKP